MPIILFFLDSVKYFKGGDGFVYKKSGENPQTIYLDCFNEPNCIAGARFYKQTGHIETFGTHSDEKTDESIIFKIAFETFLKNQARSNEFASTSVLNLYKNALSDNFKGIWLPTNHKSTFLAKLRRIRKYENEKKKVGKVCTRPSRATALTSDASTSPMIPSSMSIPQNQSVSNQSISPIVSPIVIPPPSPFANVVRSLRSSIRKQNSMTLPASASNSVIHFLF